MNPEKKDIAVPSTPRESHTPKNPLQEKIDQSEAKIKTLMNIGAGTEQAEDVAKKKPILTFTMEDLEGRFSKNDVLRISDPLGTRTLRWVKRGGGWRTFFCLQIIDGDRIMAELKDWGSVHFSNMRLVDSQWHNKESEHVDWNNPVSGRFEWCDRLHLAGSKKVWDISDFDDEEEEKGTWQPLNKAPSFALEEKRSKVQIEKRSEKYTLVELHTLVRPKSLKKIWPHDPENQWMDRVAGICFMAKEMQLTNIPIMGEKFNGKAILDEEAIRFE